MTSNPLRPEEERSLHEAHPEIISVPPRPESPHDRAQALVANWEASLGHGSPLPDVVRITLTNDVRDRMRDDIVALLNDTIRREHG